MPSRIYYKAGIARWIENDEFAAVCKSSDDKSVEEATWNVDVTETDHYGRSRLHCAAFFSRLAACKILLQKASVHNQLASTDEDGFTALHCAVYGDDQNGVSVDPNVVATLLSAGADVDATAAQRYDETPLLVCTNPDAMLLLIQAGADVTRSDSTGWTVLHQAASVPALASLIPTLLSACGPMVDLVDLDGDTPLLMCSSPEALQHLIDAGADITIRNKHGRSVLHQAASTPALADLIPSLLARGLQANVSDNFGYTPLLKCTSTVAMDHLLDAGADVIQRNRSGESVLHIVASDVRLSGCIHRLLTTCSAEMVLEPDFQGKNALHHAAEFSNDAVALVLLDSGAAFKLVRQKASQDWFWFTPLHMLARYNCSASVEVLVRKVVEAGADIDSAAVNENDELSRYHSRQTPLHCAALAGNYWATTELLQLGAGLSPVALLREPDGSGWDFHNCLSAAIRHIPVWDAMIHHLLATHGQHDTRRAMRWVLAKYLRSSASNISCSQRLKVMETLVGVGANFGADMPADLLWVVAFTTDRTSTDSVIEKAASQCRILTKWLILQLLAKSGGQWSPWYASSSLTKYLQGHLWDQDEYQTSNQEQNPADGVESWWMVEGKPGDVSTNDFPTSQELLTTVGEGLQELDVAAVGYLVASGVLAAEAIPQAHKNLSLLAAKVGELVESSITA